MSRRAHRGPGCICCELQRDDGGRPMPVVDGICAVCQAELRNARFPRYLVGLLAFLRWYFCEALPGSGRRLMAPRYLHGRLQLLLREAA